MLERTRQLLLTQYIGAIVAAFMLVDAISNVVSALGAAAMTLYLRSRSSSLAQDVSTQLDKTLTYGSAIGSVIRAILFFAVFLALVRWLYPTPPSPEPKATPASEAQ